MRRFLVVVVIFIVLAPAFWATSSPTQTRPDAILQAPSAQHWLGTDHLGRDMWSRLLYGGQRTLVISTLGWSVAIALGTLAGVIAASARRMLAHVVNMLLFFFLAVPSLVTSLLLLTLLGRGVGQMALAVGTALFALLGVAVRGQVRWLYKQAFFETSIALGAGWWDVTKRHVLPYVGDVVLTYSGILYGYVLVTTAGLGFLGLGGDPSLPEWGMMLAEARYTVRYAPQAALVTGAALTLLVFSVNRASAEAMHYRMR